MFTDMVGYSKLTGDDQNLALELLQEHDKIIEPIINRYDGEIIKRIGDAIVAIFSNSQNIIQSSIEIQQSLKNRNIRNIQARHIVLRIGLHYGDIIIKNNEVHGLGYEIASQIEPICEYGGIAISQDLYTQVKESDQLIIKGTKNHFFIRPIATFKLKSCPKIDIYKLHLNLLDWYDEAPSQSSDYLSEQGVSESNYSPFNISRNEHDLENDWLQANKFEHEHNLSYAIYHYKMYLDYNLNLSKIQSHYVELIILHIFSQCGLVRLVDRVIKDKLKSQVSETWLHSYVLGINCFNDNNFADAINHFNHAQEILINNNQSFDELKELKNTYNVIDLTYFYKTLIFLKKNDKDMLDNMNNKMVNDSKLMHGYKVLTNLISQFLNNKSDNIQDLYKSIYKDKNLNKNAKLFLYWVLIIISKKSEIKFSIKIQNTANKLIEYLSDCIFGFQLKQFFIEKPLLHQFLAEEIEFSFIEDEGLDDFAEPEHFKTEKLTTFNFCVECGFKNENKFQFCPACGSKLTK